VCSACIEGELHETRYPYKNSITSKRFLKIPHKVLRLPTFDILDGKKYFLVIVDDYSRYTRVYFFKRKSET
jgi:hypothetical protein